MNNNGYLIPANAKKGSLIFSIFRPMDLIILVIGLVITIIWLIAIDTTDILQVVIACLPLAITVLLVIPIPNHHNVLVAIISIIEYYKNPRYYKWKGWCIHEQDKH